ncbi:MAG: hypothetical protein JWL71_1073 [Acidobacteria bacterium]|nr:hypothetical protein [Acidobacteriota bacterium]
MAAVSFADACGLLERALAGRARGDILAGVSASNDFTQALRRLRAAMRAHAWKTGADRIELADIVGKYDRRTRQDGFHVLHDWDGKADHVNDDIIPIDVLDYVIARRGADPLDAAALAILLDYYFLHLLALFALRIWDEGDADANLDRLAALLVMLQGPDGSGQRFVDDAETLILIATSHFEIVERGYATLLARVRTLNDAHRVRIALAHTVSMGSHLRFGFEATYGRDTVVMRDDNVADYPWLCFALMTVMQEYARLDAAGADEDDQAPIVEGILNGLSADARAFVGEPPSSLSGSEADRGAFRALFLQHREPLAAAFQRYKPAPDHYSPLSFFFNFSHNVLKGTVVDALLRGRAWPLSFDDMLTTLSRADGEPTLKTELAVTLMGYARANPDTIRGRPMPVIVYDPSTGRDAFAVTMRKIRE